MTQPCEEWGWRGEDTKLYLFSKTIHLCCTVNLLEPDSWPTLFILSDVMYLLFSVGTKTKFLIFVGVSYWLLCDRCILDFFYLFSFIQDLYYRSHLRFSFIVNFPSWIREDSFNLNIWARDRQAENRQQTLFKRLPVIWKYEGKCN